MVHTASIGSRAGAAWLALCLGTAQFVGAQEPATSAAAANQPSDEGRRISEYDFAVSHAMQALMAAGVEQRRVTVYVARKEKVLWHVYFGSFDIRRPRFRIAYEVVQKRAGSQEFSVRKYRRNVSADANLTHAAMALVTALGAFQPRSIRFNSYVWPDAQGRWVAYFAPTVGPGAAMQRTREVDRRVLVSQDARNVLELRNFPEGVPSSTRQAAEILKARGPRLADFVNFFLRPQFAPLTVVMRRLVCRMNWRGRITSCVIGPPR